MCSHSFKVWNSPAGSSDNLTNRTASISSSSSLVDFAPLTDSSHCSPRSPLNTVWDANQKPPTLAQRGYSPNHPTEWGIDIIHPGDPESDLANGMNALVVGDSSPKSVHKPAGRGLSYAGLSDVQASGMPMSASSPAARAIALHHQRSDPSIAQAYAYGQPNGVYYPNVPMAGRDTYSGFNQYSYGTPPADPSVFGSPVPSGAAHRMPYAMAGYSTPSSFYPDASPSPSTYYYAPAQGLVYPSPQMGHTPMPATMHSPVPGMSRSKGEMQVCHGS